MGVWIEIIIASIVTSLIMSLPSWECGLKCLTVAGMGDALASLPSWECGLKYHHLVINRIPDAVTPFLGVWIEISNEAGLGSAPIGHSLLGSVD